MPIACIGSDREMRDLLPEWTALWRRVPDATPFQSPAWLLAWWKHFGTGAPRVLTARVENGLTGVLPLYDLSESWRPQIAADRDRSCRTISTRSSIRRGPIRGRDARGDCGSSGLERMPFAGPAGGRRAAWRARPGGAGRGEAGRAPCPVLALPDRAAALDTIVPRKTLRDLRQAASRAEAAGGVRIETADADTLASMMDDLLALHEARWRSRGEPGVLADPAVQDFHRNAAPALAAEGMLRLYRMGIGGTVAAVYYGFAWRGRSYAYLGGFDPDMPRLSPGALIMRHAIGAAIAEGCAAFDFLRGGEAYKYAGRGRSLQRDADMAAMNLARKRRRGSLPPGRNLGRNRT